MQHAQAWLARAALLLLCAAALAPLAAPAHAQVDPCRTRKC